MSQRIDDLLDFIESLGGVLMLHPSPGDGSPEIAWGDSFCYYAPDGVLPPGQPFATIVTKDYPGEPSSALGDGVFRVNVDAGRRDQAPTADPARRDAVMPHPVYGRLGWVCVVQPGPESVDELRLLLRDAHHRARSHWKRRRGASGRTE